MANKKTSYWIFVLMFLIACIMNSYDGNSLPYSMNATFSLTASSSPLIPGININLNSPATATTFGNSSIDFNVILIYNSALSNLSCNLSVDSNVVGKNINATTSVTNIYLDLNQGIHYWYVSCSDGNVIQISETKSFIIDLEPPYIKLITPQNALTMIESMELNFTPYDNLASYLLCNLTLDGNVINANMNIAPGVLKSVVVSPIKNGTHYWNVSCVDRAFNLNNSITQLFYVNTEQEFDVVFNLEKYRLPTEAKKDNGYYIITAPFNSEVTILVTDPKGNSILRTYKSPFPIVDKVDFTDYVGVYNIESILKYQGAIKKINKSIEVINSMSAEVVASNYNPQRSENVEFRVTHSGGIGEKTYEWDFGDGTSGFGQTISHAYQNTGSYSARVKVRDSKGNFVIGEAIVDVRDKINVKINVFDIEERTPIKDALVVFNGEKSSTNGDGEVSFNVRPGVYSVFVRHDYYSSYFEEIGFYQNTTHVVSLNKIIKNNTPVISNYENLTIKKENYSEVFSEGEKENYESMLYDYELKDTDDIGVLMELVKSAESKIKRLSSKEERVAEYIQISKKLSDAQTELKRAERDIFGLKRIKSEEERKQREKEIMQQIEKIKDSVIVDIKVLNSKEFSSIPTNSEIEFAVREYLKMTNKTEERQFKEEIISKINEIQQEVVVSSEIYSIEVVYLSTKKSEMILVKRDYLVKGNLSNKIIFDIIQEEIKNPKIEIINGNSEIMQNERIIKSRVSEKQGSIIYLIKNKIDIAEAERILSIPFFEGFEHKAKKSWITGLSILSVFKEIEDPTLLIEIVVIIVLLIVYLVYQFEVIDRVQLLLNKDPEINDIREQLNEMKRCLDDNEYSNAAVVYQDVMKMYKALTPEKKEKIHEEVIGIYNRMLFAELNELIKRTYVYIDLRDIEHAKQNYNQIKEIYSKLSEGYQKQVKDKCMDIFNKISSF